MHFWTVFRSERAVSTIFPSYIMPNRTYGRKKNWRYPPFKNPSGSHSLEYFGSLKSVLVLPPQIFGPFGLSSLVLQKCRQGAQCSGFAHLHPPSLVRGTPTIPAGSDERRPPQPSVSRVSAAPQSSLCCPGQEVEASAGGRGQSLHHYTRGLGISGLILIVHWVGGWGVAAIAAAATPRSSFRD